MSARIISPRASASSLPAAGNLSFTMARRGSRKASEPRHSWIGFRPMGLPAALLLFPGFRSFQSLVTRFAQTNGGPKASKSKIIPENIKNYEVFYDFSWVDTRQIPRKNMKISSKICQKYPKFIKYWQNMPKNDDFWP